MVTEKLPVAKRFGILGKHKNDKGCLSTGAQPPKFACSNVASGNLKNAIIVLRVMSLTEFSVELIIEFALFHETTAKQAAGQH